MSSSHPRSHVAWSEAQWLPFFCEDDAALAAHLPCHAHGSSRRLNADLPSPPVHDRLAGLDPVRDRSECVVIPKRLPRN